VKFLVTGSTWFVRRYIVGEGQHADSLFSQLNSAFDAGDETFPMSEGNQIREFLDAKSAAKMIISIATQKNIVGVINCYCGIPKTVLEFVKSIISARNGKIKLEPGAYPYEPMEY
jgi:nucleoside-diphosphate-sugar epimerase